MEDNWKRLQREVINKDRRLNGPFREVVKNLDDIKQITKLIMNKPEVTTGCSVPKGWGEEIIIENNENYCGKVLVFNKGCKFSMHYHMKKDETWYVEQGEFIYRWIDTETAKIDETIISHGDVVRQLPGQPHQIEALTNGRIFEVSTHHEDSDSYRVMPGDSQTKDTSAPNPHGDDDFATPE